MTEALSQIAGTGLMGAILVVALTALYLKDKRLNEEMNNRIKDGQETQKLLMQVQQQVIEAVHKLSEIIEYVEKRYDDAARDLRGSGRRPP